ncbi:MAG: SAM-dependent methyltransferase [Acidimicrobiia bacterium]|nr:SAM-dependent methyltransferase [Acidimicrobiia bacterium]
MTSRGSVTIVGTGIRGSTQLTPEAGSAITAADVVHYVVPDIVTENLILDLARKAKTLADLYSENRPRSETYALMFERIMGDVRDGFSVCGVFYGHPGVFVDPSHAVIAAAQHEGYPARMFPAVSAADSLYADLGLDPGARGIQMYSATDFVLWRPVIETRAPLILWQLAFLGAPAGVTEASREHLPTLVERLEELYPADHIVLLYEAAPMPPFPAKIEHVQLKDLSSAAVRMAMTLVVPPLGEFIDDKELAARMGVD